MTSEATPEDDVPSESGASEQSEELMLDSFDKDIAEPLEAFNDAVTSTTAFLQPSEQLSILARSAAKVCHFHQCAFAAGQAEGWKAVSQSLLGNCVSLPFCTYHLVLQHSVHSIPVCCC